MSSATVSSTNLAALRTAIARLPARIDRVLSVTAEWKPDDGFYLVDIRLEQYENLPYGESQRKTLLHSGFFLTARGGTKYYKTPEALLTDFARLFSVESVPVVLDLRIINWSEPFSKALINSD